MSPGDHKHPVILIALFCIAVLVVIFSSDLLEAQLCKWTDENGTVHYAEQCPEKVDSKPVELEKGPSASEIEAAKARAQALTGEKLARKADKELTADVDKLLDGSADMDRAIQCVVALREQRILKLQLAVFRDENGTLHYNRSYYDQSYKGPRSYIDDADRPSVLDDAEKRSEAFCGDSEEDLERQRVAAAAILGVDICKGYRERAEKLRRSRSPGSSDMADWLEERCED